MVNSGWDETRIKAAIAKAREAADIRDRMINFFTVGVAIITGFLRMKT